MRVFISCPFTGLCDEQKYEIKDEYKEFFNNLTRKLEEMGCEYYLAIKREKYFSQEYDITLIELKDNDNVEQYIELDGSFSNYN